MIFEDLFRNPLHLMTLLVIVMVLMGGNRLKDTMGSFGTGIREFKKNVKDDSEPPTATAQLAMAAAMPASMALESGVSEDAGLARAPLVQALSCPSCGNINPMNAKVCNLCGTAVS